MSLVTIPEEDVPLAVAASASDSRTVRGKKKKHMVSGLVAAAIMVVKRVAKRNGTDPINVMRKLNQAGMVRAVGRWRQTGELDTNDVVPVIAEIFGCIITMGPIRVHPNGTFEICMSRGQWQPATDELLQSLDAAAMMSGRGATQSMAEMAARIILDWRDNRRTP